MPSQSQYDDEFFKIASTLDLKEPKRVVARFSIMPSVAVMAATLMVMLLAVIMQGPMIYIAAVAFTAGTLAAAKLYPQNRILSSRRGGKVDAQGKLTHEEK